MPLFLKHCKIIANYHHMHFTDVKTKNYNTFC